MKQNKVISASNLSIGYGKTKHREGACLYTNLSFDLFGGEMVCLLGANGVGKSTLLRTLSRSQPILDGYINLNDRDISTYTSKDLSQQLALVLTDKISAGGLTVRELVELGRYPYTGFFGQLSQLDKEIVDQAMKDVGIDHKADSYVSQLSDGERQKVMIAKGLSQESPILLLDEPTAFLDIESRIEIMMLLHRLAINNNKAILLSTHDVDLALLLADRLWLLGKDRGLVCGVGEDLIFGGEMDHLFHDEKIIFDINTGAFLPKKENTERVYIQSTNNTLLHWTANLTAKYGYNQSANKEECVFCIEVTSANSIQIETNSGGSYTFQNFAQLADYLRNNG